MKKYLASLFCILFALMYSGCSSSDDGKEEKTTSPAGTDSGAIALNSSVGGSVSSSATDQSVAYFPAANQYYSQFSSGNSCSNATFEVFMVGGDGTAISSGSSTNGSFTAKVNADNEVVIKFSCNLKCFGKPGSSDLVCDPVSNAVVLSLESSLKSSVEKSPLFKGLSIAKIAEGMVETLKLMSKLNPTNNIVEKLLEKTNAGGPNMAAGIKEIIDASPVGAMFVSLATMAEEKKAENEAIARGETKEQAKTAAAEASWNVEKIVNLLTGLGIAVEIELDGEMSLYHDMFTSIDSWIGSDFHYVRDFRAYLRGLYTTLYENKKTSNLSFTCVARNKQQWDAKPIIYPPYKNASGDSFTLSCLHVDPSSDTDEMGITTAGGTQLAQDASDDKYRLKAFIKPSLEEANRNDPKGEYEKEMGGGFKDFSVSFIDIFPEFEAAMGPGGVCAAYVTMGANGPTGFKPGFTACVKTNHLAKYFSGLLGIYRFMRNSTLRSTKFSLADLYNTLVGINYMGMRLNGDFWSLGLDNRWVRVKVDSHDVHLPAWQLKDTNTERNRVSIYTAECPAPLCVDGHPVDPSANVTMDLTQLKTLLGSYKPSYNSTMKMFERIPTMTEIKDSIYKDAHHEPYNIAGPKMFHVKGNVASGGDDWKADAPVLCVINAPNAAGDFLSGQSSIVCDEADSVTWDSDGKPSDTSTYKAYYALRERGGNGGSGEDAYYGLINVNNGMEYRLNGREFRVRGIKSGVSADVTADGQSLHSVNNQFCELIGDGNGGKRNQCWFERFDYVAVSLDADLFPTAYFHPYTWPVEITSSYDDGSGTVEEHRWNMPIVITQNDTNDNWDDDWPVCVHKDAVTVDGNDDSKVTVDANTTIDATSDLVDCFSTTEATFYYLTPNQGKTNRSEITFRLVRNDGMWMTDNSNDAFINVKIGTIEAAGVLNKKVAPDSVEARLNQFEIANLGHDPKFDPFCDDVNNDGECGCKDAIAEGGDGDGKCTLADPVDEPTLSTPPFWPGSPNAKGIKIIIDTCGGKNSAGEASSDTSLQNCLTQLKSDATTDITQVSADWNKLFTCVDASGDNKMSWVDINRMVDVGNADRSNVGYPCAGNAPGTPNMGPVKMRKVIPRKNAYNIHRPNKVLKLISAATAGVGTGVTIGKTEKKFTFREAIALIFLRFAFPMRAVVQNSGGDDLGTIPVFMDKVHLPGKNGSPTSGLLRAFLEEGKVLDPASE